MSYSQITELLKIFQMRLITSTLITVVIALLSATPVIAKAQTSLADLKAQVDAASAELDEVDVLLNDVDPNRRSAAMTLLMESGNPKFVERAIEVGLLSFDSRMRAAALQMALKTSGTFTLKIDLTNEEEEKTKIRGWLGNYGKGTWDEETKTGTLTFRVGEFDEKSNCWPFLTSEKCAMIVDGERVMLQGWSYAVGAVSLADDGTLKGTFGYNYNNDGVPLPTTIRLIE